MPGHVHAELCMLHAGVSPSQCTWATGPSDKSSAQETFGRALIAEARGGAGDLRTQVGTARGSIVGCGGCTVLGRRGRYVMVMLGRSRRPAHAVESHTEGLRTSRNPQGALHRASDAGRRRFTGCSEAPSRRSMRWRSLDSFCCARGAMSSRVSSLGSRDARRCRSRRASFVGCEMRKADPLVRRQALLGVARRWACGCLYTGTSESSEQHGRDFER